MTYLTYHSADHNLAQKGIWRDISVRNLLWLAFSVIVLMAVLALGFALSQMKTINGSTKLLYAREYAAGQAAEQVRGLIFKASRSQAQLLTATTDMDARVWVRRLKRACKESTPGLGFWKSFPTPPTWRHSPSYCQTSLLSGTKTCGRL
jgi:hypothetical protein